jgi:hypothetical protein
MTHTVRVRAACLVLLTIAVSCQSNPPPVANAKSQAATVTHVVFVWLKAPGDAEARKKVVATSRTFATIPGVVSVNTGTALPSTRPVVDSSYDVAILMTFTDEAALRAYDQHPTHKKAVDEVLKPLAAKLQIYDITSR